MIFAPPDGLNQISYLDQGLRLRHVVYMELDWK